MKTSPPLDMSKVVQDLASASDLATTAGHVVAATARATQSRDVGITLLGRGGRLQSISPTTESVIAADRSQYELGEGPCVDAALNSLVLWCGDLRIEDRWPRWAPRAVELGYHSILSVELHAGERRVGGLNVYGREPAAFDVDVADTVRELAQHAAIALAHAGELEHLQVALATRNLIGQAQGILMERHRIDSDRAFAVLRRYSQDHNIKLRTVAETLVRTTRLPDAPDPTAIDPASTDS